MVWSGPNPLSMLECMLRRLTTLWRLVTMIFFPLLRLFALPWRKNERPEVNEEKEAPTFPESVVEFECEGQHEAASGKRAASFDSEPFRYKRLKYEEEDEEEEFDSKEYRVEPTDELYCGYDSTWETEQDQESSFRNSRRPAASRYYKFSRFENAARDMQNYRHNYPNQTKIQHWKQQASDDKPNLNFYIGQTRTLPDGVHIKDFHNEWHGEYDTLEYVHTYIQWLFPLQEPGMNFEATPLTKEEINEFLKSSTAKENLLKSYKLMLDFYGIELCDAKTGEVKRAWNWSDRFHNLDSHTHNNLRITRILKCLGTLGYRHYQAPLVRFFLEETLVNGELPHVKDSVLNYFLFAVLDKRQRRNLIKFAFLNYDCKDEFVWCPKKIQKLWSKSPRQMSDKKDAPSVEFLSVRSEAQHV
ncbi:opioid growth factor receptor-like [Acanthochromis polyacanthus]|uniref:opioid growth factor receptor-like n=1 Tax=Acanthochromis polyacanthus TaxID=80966 RepID=UPI000B9042F3|nr:opioid growth factor receptor-like [Acanthochromis polyacanthus]